MVFSHEFSRKKIGRGRTRIDSRNYMGVSKNNGTPKSSILIGFSLMTHPFWGKTPYFWFNTHINGTNFQTLLAWISSTWVTSMLLHPLFQAEDDCQDYVLLTWWYTGDRQGRTPIPTHPYGKSLYKPYSSWVFMGKLSPRIPRERNKHHGYTVRGTPNCPLRYTICCIDFYGISV